MNPMIAFGWAVQSGAYKVWACDSSCAAFCGSDDFSTVFMHVTLPPYSFRSYLYVCMVTHILRKFCLLFLFFALRISTTTWFIGLPRPWAPFWPRYCSPSSKRPSWTTGRRRAKATEDEQDTEVKRGKTVMSSQALKQGVEEAKQKERRE